MTASRTLKLLMALAFVACRSFAQDAQREKALSAIKDLADRYQNAPALSFDVSYVYTDEAKPGIVLDSLKGSFKMDKDAYCYSIDKTESIGNKDYVLMLFKEDNLMYISKPSTSTRLVSPIAMFDSLLSGNKNVSCTILESKAEKRMVFTFSPGLKYKKIEYWISKETGYVTTMAYCIRTSELMPASTSGLPSDISPYASIEVAFTNYKTKGFDTRELDMGLYFKKENGEYTVAPAYSTYKIFLGSTNL